MSRRIAILLAAGALLAACDDPPPCEVTLRMSWALDGLREGNLREVPLRCGDDAVLPGSSFADRLVSDAPEIAAIHESYWSSSPTGTNGPHAGWYLLAHAPGTCRLEALRGDQVVAVFDVTIAAQ